ncbi:MAG: DUF1127 domain-containing protein [Alphaproteobacteria bacterium]
MRPWAWHTPLAAVRTWRAVRRQRIALSRLDRRLLADIGVDPDAACRECEKPPWRA